MFRRVLFIAVLMATTEFEGRAMGGDCLADPAWFPGAIPDPQPVSPDVPLPKDADECDFYRWAWQTFLYITHPDGAGQRPRFLDYAAPIDLFENQAADRLARARRRKGTLNLMPRGAKRPSGATVDDVIQSLSNGLIVDHSGRAVYYGTHVNEAFVTFVRRNGFDTDVTKIGDYNMPVDKGSLELKSSWKVLDPETDDKDRFFTVEADFPRLKTIADPSDPAARIVTVDLDGEPLHDTLALVGLHVVGTVKDHPEFIWATFEHVRNAPGLVNQKVDGSDAVDATSDFTFYDLGTPRSECNVNARKSLTLDVKTQALAPVTQVFRQFRYGSKDGAKTGANDPDPDVASLNRDVHARLRAAKSVWQHYFLVGAVWINDPEHDFVATDDTVSDDVLKGEVRLSNSTMETFTQHEKQVMPPPGPTKPNCFRCHNTSGETTAVNGKMVTLPAQQINVSHVLRNAFFQQ